MFEFWCLSLLKSCKLNLEQAEKTRKARERERERDEMKLCGVMFLRGSSWRTCLSYLVIPKRLFVKVDRQADSSSPVKENEKKIGIFFSLQIRWRLTKLVVSLDETVDQKWAAAISIQPAFGQGSETKFRAWIDRFGL